MLVLGGVDAGSKAATPFPFFCFLVFSKFTTLQTSLSRRRMDSLRKSESQTVKKSRVNLFVTSASAKKRNRVRCKANTSTPRSKSLEPFEHSRNIKPPLHYRRRSDRTRCTQSGTASSINNSILRFSNRLFHTLNRDGVLKSLNPNSQEKQTNQT